MQTPMEYDCHIFSNYLVFQMKNLVFQAEYLVFRSKPLDFDRTTRYFESEISNYQVFHTLNLKYYVFRAKYLLFQKRCKISGFQCISCMFFSIGFLHIRRSLSKYHTPAQLEQQQKHLTPFVDSFTLQRVRVVR